MTIENHSDDYRRGLELAEAGQHAEALEHINRYLSDAPDDAEALNDAGAILHCLGRSPEAIEHLEKAHSIRPDCGEILWNLCEALIAAGRADETMKLFARMEELKILSADVCNRAATELLNRDQKSQAVEMMLKSLELAPEQRVMQPMLDLVILKRPKIAFFCGGDGPNFLNDIIEYTRKRYQVRVFEGETHDQLRELMQWSDISWFEWCTNLAVAASNMPKVCKNIVRLHRYEAYEDWPLQVNWNNIDTLVTVGNPTTNQVLLSKVPNLEARTNVVAIPNGIDLDRFRFVERPRGKNLAFLANLRMVKNPVLILQCMQKLHYLDPEYRLHIAGRIQDETLARYVKHMVRTLGLEGVVSFDGWQDDVNAWLSDKHYIVSSSICEGHPVGILEAMACGLKPVIHNYPGAESIFPREFLFDIAEQFCDQILSGGYEPGRYREFVESRFSLQKQLNAVNDLFIEAEKANEVKPNSPPPQQASNFKFGTLDPKPINLL